MLELGREACGNLSLSATREWLVTNGIGGYASGTVAGLLTRRYHGLLVAALRPPLGRTLLLAKLDEAAAYDDLHYSLFANQWAGGHIDPLGFEHLERFHLEGTTPAWTFACADALLVKRVWMQQGANTTYIRYDLTRASKPLTLAIKALVDYRDHHGNTHATGWQRQRAPLANGLRVTAVEGAAPLYLLGNRAGAIPQHEWYRSFYLRCEEYRGLDPIDDNLHAATFHATLQPGESLTLVASTDASPNLDGQSAYVQRQAHENQLLAQAGAIDVGRGRSPADGQTRPSSRAAQSRRVGEAQSFPRGENSLLQPWIEQLVLAADQFIVRRPLPGDLQGWTVIAGYPWFGDWGRDTVISLPGLTLVTGRAEVATGILRTFARFVDRGMLPNRFAEVGEEPEYNTLDATLWYVQAIRAYYAASGDEELLGELFPVLEEVISRHERGTRHNIHVDPADGLIYGGEEGVQLTWMDAKAGDWVVTPRIGKPVEVNALWYNALRTVAEFARVLGKPAERYEVLAEQAHSGFARFWNQELGYCYDVLDGPDGHDPALRPNQLLAVSLPHSPLDEAQQRAVVDVCARHLVSSHGLRSLAPEHPAYLGRYGGDQRQRDAAYHQGTVWGWLVGPFVEAHLRVYGDPVWAQSYLLPLARQLAGGAVGSIHEIFDGDPPHTPRGCFAQAWSVAELARAWQLTEDAKDR